MKITFLSFHSYQIYFSVHPCDNGDNGGCDHTCTKDGDEAICSCKENHLLQPDEKTCKIGKFYTLVNRITSSSFFCTLFYTQPGRNNSRGLLKHLLLQLISFENPKFVSHRLCIFFNDAKAFLGPYKKVPVFSLLSLIFITL